MLLQIPPEILLVIFGLLDIPDVLKVRQTCRALYKITYDRTVWVAFMRDQAKYLPLPPDIQQVFREDDLLQTSTTSIIERSVVKNRHIAEAWPRVRSATPQKLQKNNSNGLLMALQLFIERWIVAMYYDGTVLIYDTLPAETVLQASLHLEALRLLPAHAFSVDGERLLLFLSSTAWPYLLQIYQLNFSDVPFTGFELIQGLVLPGFKSVKAIDATQRLLILSSPSFVEIEIVNWDEQELDPRRPVFRINTEEMEALVNAVIAVRFLGSHILVFKIHTLEVFRYKNHTPGPYEPPGFVLKHSFHMSFRDGTFSDYSTTCDPLSGNTIYEMDLFSCDVIQGLFHYSIRLSVPPPSAEQALPFLNVDLTSVYPLAYGVLEPLPASVSAPVSQINRPTENPSPSPSFSHAHFGSSRDHSSARTHTQDNGRRNTDNHGYRGFVSAHCLGPQAKRGIWVERKRTSTVREVHVWSREPPSSSRSFGSILPFNSRRRLAGKFKGGEGQAYVSEMERRVIYTLHSYDLRDDITTCTFAEVSGTIVLGHRSGEISVLKVEL